MSLWNKSFIKKNDGRLLCEEPCQTNPIILPDWQTTSTVFKQPNLDLDEHFTNGSFSSISENHLPPLVSKFKHYEQNSNFNSKKSNSNLNKITGGLDTHRSIDSSNLNQLTLDTNEVCYLCKKLVKDKEKFIYEDNIYHQHCLTCNECNCKLFYMRKIFKNPSNIYDESTFCEPCYYKIFGEKCSKCLQPVPPYCFSVRHEDKIYHKECFLCVRCKKTLANKQVYRVGNVLICKSCF